MRGLLEFVAQLYREDYVDAAVICTLTCRDAFSVGNVQSSNVQTPRRINPNSSTEQVDRDAQCHFHFKLTMRRAIFIIHARTNVTREIPTLPQISSS